MVYEGEEALGVLAKALLSEDDREWSMRGLVRSTCVWGKAYEQSTELPDWELVLMNASL